MVRTMQSTPSWQGRPVWAEIDLDALAHNVAILKERCRDAQPVSYTHLTLPTIYSV